MDIGILKILLIDTVEILKFILETVSVICVTVGFAKTLYISIFSGKGLVENVSAKLCFGRWLAMALEFQLAADVLNTTIDPDIEGLIKLFGIALIRTFLNYFLMKEIEMQSDNKKPVSTAK